MKREENKNEEVNEKYKSEQRAFMRITNDALKCKDCLYKYDDSIIYGNTSRCSMFSHKTNEILLGGECNKYVKFTGK